MSSIFTSTINCARSGLPLVGVSVLCRGGTPLLASFDKELYHPIYGLSLGAILTRMNELITEQSEAAWMLPEGSDIDLRLCMSAVMYQLGCIWTPHPDDYNYRGKLVPSLPNSNVAASGAIRLFKLARWYHFSTSKRMDLPMYRISKQNGNLTWENFSTWLDDAYSVRTEWETGREELNRQDQLRLYTEALHMVRSADVYKRLDFRKVWGWLDLQMCIDSRYPAGRRETFKSLFTKGDAHPEEWTMDDIEDLQIAIIETCDRENDVYFFVNQRIMNLRSVIEDFYGSFTLLSGGEPPATGAAAVKEQEASTAFFASFDAKAQSMEQLPPEPQRMQYVTLGKFLQARAQWNILKARFESKGG